MMCEPALPHGGDGEDPYPSLSDYHDYEPNLEFDDTELEHVASPGKNKRPLGIINITAYLLCASCAVLFFCYFMWLVYSP